MTPTNSIGVVPLKMPRNTLACRYRSLRCNNKVVRHIMVKVLPRCIFSLHSPTEWVWEVILPILRLRTEMGTGNNSVPQVLHLAIVHSYLLANRLITRILICHLRLPSYYLLYIWGRVVRHLQCTVGMVVTLEAIHPCLYLLQVPQLGSQGLEVDDSAIAEIMNILTGATDRHRPPNQMDSTMDDSHSIL